MNSRNFTRPGKRNVTILFVISSLIVNCNYHEEITKWNEVKINPEINKDSIYEVLDKQPEIFSVFEKQDSLMKRTSDVAYFIGNKRNPKDSQYAKVNNCRAYFYHSDTLSINIGIGNGFGGNGFVVRYKDNSFYTEPYFFTDIIIENELVPTYNSIYQKLTLNKAHYSPGDSIYGRIEFKSIETNRDNEKTEHFGIGNFRAKIEKIK